MLIHGKSQTNPGILGIKFQQTSLILPKPRGFGKAGKEQEFQEFQALPGNFIPFLKKNPWSMLWKHSGIWTKNGNSLEFKRNWIPQPNSPLESIPLAGNLLFPELVLPDFFPHVPTPDFYSYFPSRIISHRLGINSFPSGRELIHFPHVGN